MIFNWYSESTEILLNPRIPEGDRIRYQKLLEKGNHLKGHIWLATSGTTGHFKFVALSKEAILASAEAVNTHLQVTSKDIWLHSLPDFHVGGIGIWARSHLSQSGVFDYKKLTPKWDPVLFTKVSEKEKVTITALVPAQVYDLIKHNLSAPQTIRASIVGGGALAPELYKKACDLGWNLLPSYGMTECCSQVATARPGQCKVAEILSHVKIRIDEEETIWIKSPSLLTCYGVVEEDGIRFFDPKQDGWFQTEDKGELIEVNSLRVFGRSADFVKIGGESVNLLHLQNMLDTLKEKKNITSDVAIYPVKDERLGYVVHLMSDATEGVSDLIDAFNQQVMPYERIRLHNLVDKIPRSPLGKLQLK